MEKRRFKKLNQIDNKGYSLVELIIVIAIIAIFTGASLITLSVMHSAKAKEASITFESEVSELLNKSKGNAVDANLDGVIDNSDKGYSLGLRVHKNGQKCYIQKVLVKDGAYEANNAFEKANNHNDGKGISLSASVYVEYTDFSGNKTVIGSNAADTMLIYFNKRGACVSGYGVYNFYKTDGVQVAKTTINKNGSFQTK